MKANINTIHGLAIFLDFALVATASADIGSEAGNWEYRINPGHNSNESVVEKNSQNALCSNC